MGGCPATSAWSPRRPPGLPAVRRRSARGDVPTVRQWASLTTACACVPAG